MATGSSSAAVSGAAMSQERRLAPSRTHAVEPEATEKTEAGTRGLIEFLFGFVFMPLFSLLSPVQVNCSGEVRLDNAGSRQLFVLGHGLENLARDVVAGDAFALGGQVRDDAVPENRQSHRGHVVAAHVELAVEHGAGFGGHDQVQAGA